MHLLLWNHSLGIYETYFESYSLSKPITRFLNITFTLTQWNLSLEIEHIFDKQKLEKSLSLLMPVCFQGHQFHYVSLYIGPLSVCFKTFIIPAKSWKIEIRIWFSVCPYACVYH